MPLSAERQVRNTVECGSARDPARAAYTLRTELIRAKRREIKQQRITMEAESFRSQSMPCVQCTAIDKAVIAQALENLAQREGHS